MSASGGGDAFAVEGGTERRHEGVRHAGGARVHNFSFGATNTGAGYGGSALDMDDFSLGVLVDQIKECEGVLLIPAFALERTHSLLFVLHELLRCDHSYDELGHERGY